MLYSVELLDQRNGAGGCPYFSDSVVHVEEVLHSHPHPQPLALPPPVSQLFYVPSTSSDTMFPLCFILFLTAVTAAGPFPKIYIGNPPLNLIAGAPIDFKLVLFCIYGLFSYIN